MSSARSIPSAAGEVVRLDRRGEELYLELPVDDRLRLMEELLHALFAEGTVTLGVDAPCGEARRPIVEQRAKPQGTCACRPHHACRPIRYHREILRSLGPDARFRRIQIVAVSSNFKVARFDPRRLVTDAPNAGLGQ